MNQEKLYGFYSKKMKLKTGRSFKYLTPTGRDILITIATTNPNFDKETQYDDVVCRGEVTKLLCHYLSPPEGYLPRGLNNKLKKLNLN